MNLAHIVETGVLVLVAYLVGCTIGYGLRWFSLKIATKRAAAPTLAAASAAGVAASRPSAAARLAATVDVMEKPTPPADEPSPPTVSEEQSDPSPVARKADARPHLLSVPLVGGADNLQKIKGIGPKIEATLNEMGIYHLDQIAGWSDENIAWVEAHLAFKGRIQREKWVDQAVLFIQDQPKA